MPQRVQHSHSLPALPSDPAAEAGRVIFFAKSDGLYGRLASGTIIGPLGAGGAGGSTAVFQDEPPASPALNDIWYDTDEDAPSPTAGFPMAIPFHVTGVFTVGIKRPRFLTPVPLTLKHAYGRIGAGSSDPSGPTYRLVRSSVDGLTVTSTETSASVPTTSVLHDLADFPLDAGDSLRIEVVAVGLAAPSPEDLSVTVYAVTR